MQGTENRTKTLVILILAVIIGVVYLLSIFLAYPIFQNTSLIDPLAEINSLFPLYYVAIALTALLGLACLIWRIENRYLHILLLMMFALMLWFTPYYLAGLVRVVDALWHVGVAMDIPLVLGGDPVAFSDYALAYPGSFIYHYSFLNIVGMEPISYMSNFFPLFFLLLFVLLCYLFLSRIFNEKVALLSMLVAIPGFHYIVMHPSPAAVASLLMLATLLLLTMRGTAATIMAIVAIIGSIISHPITPLVLSVFLAAALLTSMVYSRRIGRAQAELASMLVFCLLGWFSWLAFYSGLSWGEALRSLELQASGGYLAGAPFIYGNIENLKRWIYILYAAAGMLAILYVAAPTYYQERSIRNWLSKLGGLNPGEAFMAISVPLLALLTLLMVAIDPLLMARALTFVILALSCIIASVIVRLYRSGISKRTISAVMIGLLFLTLSFPIIAYSDDAHKSLSMSEGMGLEFLATEVPLDGKSIAMDAYYTLALYAEPILSQTRFAWICPRTGEPPDLARIQPDLVVFPRTGYYFVAMRHDLSFEDNVYTQSKAILESSEYDRIYSSSTFEVYSKNRDE